MANDRIVMPPTTSAISGEGFARTGLRFGSRELQIIFLILIAAVGSGLRFYQLGAESFGEDELNKLQTVAEYRQNGLSGKNGEHPFLMKGLQTLSLAAAEKMPSAISAESALRFPTVLIGTLSIIAIFLLVSELFGSLTGMFAALFYALDPSMIGFDRIAKEDSFVVFFFMLASWLWIRGQTVAERYGRDPKLWTFASAIAFGGMMASKYIPHMLGPTACYYAIFQAIPATKWRLGKIRWLLFFVVMGVAFLIFNPTILLPSTWHEMLTFLTEKRIVHDAYEYHGVLFTNQITKWLNGVPWTFYFLFTAVKIPLITLLLFLAGIPIAFLRRLGDGRYFLLFWIVFWWMPFSLLGGKFTRYFAVGEPVVLIVAAIGASYITFIIAKYLNRKWLPALLTTSLGVAIFWQAISAAPHYRLYTNEIGGGKESAGYYFPHDEFYDLSSREIADSIAKQAMPNVTVASETPYLLKYYLDQAGRSDIKSVSLSDMAERAELVEGDIVVAAKGRRYFSNEAVLSSLANYNAAGTFYADNTVTAKIYILNETTQTIVSVSAK